MDIFVLRNSVEIKKNVKLKIMKTKTFTISLLAMLLLIVTAKTSGQIFSLGVKAGAGFSYLSHFEKNGEDIKRFTNIMFDGGLTGNVKFTKLVSLQFEILFEQKGENYKINLTSGTGTTETEKMKIYLNYLTLPILVEFSHKFGNFILFGGLGPYIGYALDGKMILGSQKVSMKFGKDEFRRFDAGLSADLGCGYKAGPGNIILDLRYNYGFMDIEQLKDKPDGYKSHCNRNLGIYLGYVIPLGKTKAQK
jgi:hypothetical protein